MFEGDFDQLCQACADTWGVTTLAKLDEVTTQTFNSIFI